MKKVFLVLLIVGMAGVGGFLWTKEQVPKKLLKEEQVQASPTIGPTVVPKDYKKTIGDFLVTEEPVCVKDKKPIVYFFGNSSCPHCAWEKPIVQKVAKKFEGKIDYRENFDGQNDMEVFQRYSSINPGYIPFLILGCKYVRVGSGERLGETNEKSIELEEEALTVILCKLTNGEPKSVCSNLNDKISSIE